MKPVDVKSGTYIDFDEESNDKDPKFKVGDHVRKIIWYHSWVKSQVSPDLDSQLWKLIFVIERPLNHLRVFSFVSQTSQSQFWRKIVNNYSLKIEKKQNRIYPTLSCPLLLFWWTFFKKCHFPKNCLGKWSDKNIVAITCR